MVFENSTINLNNLTNLNTHNLLGSVNSQDNSLLSIGSNSSPNLSLSTPILPDLIVQNASTPTTASAGSTIQVTDQIKNQGNGAAGASFTNNETTPPPTNGYDFIGVAEHELSEIMGRVDGLKASNGTFTYATPYDLFSYQAPGVISANANVTGSYFSLDKGNTKLNTFNNVTNGGDIRDWAGDTLDAFNAYATPGVLVPLLSSTPIDIKVMNALGWISTV